MKRSFWFVYNEKVILLLTILVVKERAYNREKTDTTSKTVAALAIHNHPQYHFSTLKRLYSGDNSFCPVSR